VQACAKCKFTLKTLKYRKNYIELGGVDRVVPQLGVLYTHRVV